MDPKARKIAGISMVGSGVLLGFAGLYLLLAGDSIIDNATLVGGVIFGAGALDLVIALFFLRG